MEIWKSVTTGIRNVAFSDRHRVTYPKLRSVWPRRLLHIPTMTSVEKQGDCTYLGIEAPEYAIITYTWGRFVALPGSPALPIKGTTWTIPPVKQDCFSVDSFHRVIHEIGEEHTWLWLDVACIDQENEEVKTSEISRQVGIFHGAIAAYAWLHTLDSSTIEEALTYLSEVAAYKREHGFTKDFDADTRNNAKSERLKFYNSELDNLLKTLQLLFCDPWFTSLWTLQESILRRDAIFLAADGSTVNNEGPNAANHGYCARIKSLNDSCQVISQNLHQLIAHLPWGACRSKAQDLILVIEKGGLNFDSATNPNIQYSWARYRMTTNPKDRIYGVMGIYENALRGSFRPPPPSQISLKGLQTAFALALNNKVPWLAQCFVHLKRPEPGRSWCITHDSTVPLQFVHFEGFGVMEGMESTGCVFQAESQLILARGMSCPLRRLWEFWSNMRSTGVSVFGERYTYTLSIAYDMLVADLVANELGEHFTSPVVEWIDPELDDPANDFRVTQSLLNTFETENLRVLQMGYCSDVFVKPTTYNDQATLQLMVQHDEPSSTQVYGEGVTGAMITTDQVFLNAARAEIGGTMEICPLDFHPEMTIKLFGVVLLRDSSNFWQRIGICRWTGNVGECCEMTEWQGPMH